ncbi:MAG: hypothetical protein CHACPFDD_01739 [Phycisphaerae bacterium]|nr:hypothetical protein [Phycisphaerae bacterium]
MALPLNDAQDTPQLRPAALTRTDAWFALGVALLALLFGAAALSGPSTFGQYEDDGVYLVTARALAEGRGYRHLELPSEPYQTKYPILYPALLSLVWRVAPSFPANVAVAQWLNVVLNAASAVIAYRLLRRAWDLPRAIAAGSAALAAANPMTLATVETTMSEPLFTLLALAALERLTAWCDAGGGGRRPRDSFAAGAAAGLLAAGAALTRSIGVALLAALLCAAVTTRRWRSGVAAALLLIVAVGANAGWKSWAASQNQADPRNAAFRYDLDYGTWYAQAWPVLPRVLYHNAAALAFFLFYGVVGPPAAWVGAAMQAGPLRGLALYLLILAMLLLIALGFYVRWRRSAVPLNASLLLYLLLVWAWPFDPSRFLVPILPMLIAAALMGLHAAVCGAFVCFEQLGAARRRRHRRRAGGPATDRAPRFARGVALAAAAMLLGRYAVEAAGSPRVGWLLTPTDGPARDALVEFLRDRTRAEAVVAARQAGYLHLATGRKCLPYYPVDDPIAIYYSPARNVLFCGVGQTRGEFEAFRGYFEAHVLDYYRRAGVTHVVTPGPEWEDKHRVIVQFAEKQPSMFRLVTDVRGRTVYEFLQAQ